MRRSLVALAPMTAALILAACMGDRDTTASRLNAPQTSLAAGNPNACDFSTMKSDARAFLASSQDIIFSMISDMQTAYKNGGTAGATSVGFDILAQIASKRLTSAQGGTLDDGGRLVSDIVSTSCTNIAPTPNAEFKPGAALAFGIFEVRTGGGQARAAVALHPDATSSTGRLEPNPRWGVEPATSCAITNGADSCTWPGTAGSRYLVFGYPANAAIGDETAAGDFDGKNGFIVGMTPDMANKSVFTVGACIPVTSSTAPGTANLLAHQLPALPDGTSRLEIVGNQSPVFCTEGNPLQASLGVRGWLASVGSRAMSLFQATPLFAETDPFEGKFIGGGPSSWSPISTANLTAGDITLSFGPMPKNASVSSNLVFTVHAQTAAKHGAGGVNITVQVANNSGSPAGAVTAPGYPPNGTGITVQTNSTGDASFQISVNKAGGYTLAATGMLGASATGSATSAKFNVKNK